MYKGVPFICQRTGSVSMVKFIIHNYMYIVVTPVLMLTYFDAFFVYIT